MFVRRSSAPPLLLRAAVAWTVCTAAVTVLAPLSLGSVRMASRRGADAGFDELLVAACALVATVSATALWLAATGLLRDLLTGRGPIASGPLRRLLLAACGAAVIATATPAVGHADSTRSTPVSVTGLPLPDRTTGGIAPTAGSRTDPELVVRVAPGDSLWRLAEHRLGPDAQVADVAAYWQRIYARNASLIGPDPDRLLPGQVLHLPPTHR